MSESRKISKMTSRILDIEDGVAITAKSEARKNLVSHYASLCENLPGSQVGIRVNSVSSGLLEEDLKILPALSRAPACLLLPKIDSSSEAEYFLERLRQTLSDCPWSCG